MKYEARRNAALGRLLVILVVALTIGSCGSAGDEPAEEILAATDFDPAPPELHHVHLNTVDATAAVEWYLALWPTARATTVDGRPAVAAEMFVLFDEVDDPPPGAWNSDLHRSDPQSPFWHFGIFTNTTGLFERLAAEGIEVLPLFTDPEDTLGVRRSGLAPYSGMRTLSELESVEPADPREGGFGYVIGPDGALVELTGGPRTRGSFSHVHLFHEEPRCAANWYVEHLGMGLPPVRNRETGETSPREPWSPCGLEPAEATWPSLEPVGTIRQPSGSVVHGSGSISFYPRQCRGDRCGTDRPLVSSRGQVLDHVAFTVEGLDDWFDHLSGAGVTILEAPRPFGETRSFMIEDLDGLAIELIEREGAPVPGLDIS